MAYTDETKVENYLKRQLSAEEQAILPIIIAGITDLINRYTGHNWNTGDTAEDRYFDSEGGRILDIDGATDITEVAVLNEWSDDSGQLLTADQDFYLYPLNQDLKTTIRFIGGRYKSNMRRFRVKAKWGSGATAPDGIVLAATIMSAEALSNPQGLKQESIEGYSRTWSQEDMSPLVKNLLSSYQSILLGS